METFGNAGALFMRAMTWYDHTTESIWSQPWGRAISGELEGAELKLLPSQLATWESWKQDYPNTLVLTTDADRVSIFPERFSTDFVIGLVLARFPDSSLGNGRYIYVSSGGERRSRSTRVRCYPFTPALGPQVQVSVAVSVEARA